MAADSSVIAEVARQASSFDFANPPDGVILDTWTIPQLKEFLRPRGARLTGRKHELLAL